MDLNQLTCNAKKQQKRIAVAAAADREVLKCVLEASKEKLASFSLVGDSEKITSILDSLGSVGSSFDILDQKDPKKAADCAVELVSSGKADILMKGLLQTSTLLRAVLDPTIGLRTGSLLSHVALLESPSLGRTVFLTDCAMIISPALEEKIGIIQNSVQVAQALGIEKPKVAILGAVETVNPKMPATTDAAILTQMNRRGQIPGCTVDGPLGLDNALSKMAAGHKGIVSEVAGNADILLAPDLQSGNMMYKAAVYLGDCKTAGIIAGAKVPIVLTSRADSYQAKLHSIALAASL